MSFFFLIFRFRLRVGQFVPAVYLKQLVANSDFRKYDDALRMIIDCTPELAEEIERRLAAAARAGTVRFGLHRQKAAMMTCFAPFPTHSDHMHFVDGASGGYALAAAALKGGDQAARRRRRIWRIVMAGNLPIDGRRLWDDLMRLAEITDPGKPYTRRSFSPLFDQGRVWLRQRFEAAGLETRIDTAGNLIGRRAGIGRLRPAPS